MTTGGGYYKIEFTAASKRQLERIADPGRTRLARAIAQLAINPRPPGCRKFERAPVAPTIFPVPKNARFSGLFREILRFCRRQAKWVNRDVRKKSAV